MRVISIKNYCDNIRVIIQLMQYHNKVSANLDCKDPKQILGVKNDESLIKRSPR